MKWLRWLVLCIFLFCVWGCFYKSPFQSELTMFILPEANINTSIVSDDISRFGEVMDVRADYIQTEHNFSKYHDVNFEHNNPLLMIFEREMVRASEVLVKRQPLLKQKKIKIKINKPVVWPRSPLKPIKIVSGNIVSSNELVVN